MIQPLSASTVFTDTHRLCPVLASNEIGGFLSWLWHVCCGHLGIHSQCSIDFLQTKLFQTCFTILQPVGYRLRGNGNAIAHRINNPVVKLVVTNHIASNLLPPLCKKIRP